VKKVLLINPPGKCFIRKIDGSIVERKHCQPPLGLAYLGSACLNAGYDVEILDILAEGYEFERLTEHYIVYGLETPMVIERIRQAAPDLIGVSILFSHVASECYRIIHEIRQAFPDIPIVVGGHHPSAMPDRVMANPDIDFAMIGECDETLPQLLEALNGRFDYASIRALYYRDGDRVLNTLSGVKPAVTGVDFNYYRLRDSPNPANVAKLAYPAWHLLKMPLYWTSDVRIGGGHVMRERCLPMVASRGCPHVCYFCTSPLMGGYKGYRQRTVADVCDEIRWLKHEYDIQEIQFLDDNFYISAPRVKDLLRALAADEFSDILFSVPAGAEANALDDEVIDLMARANFYKVFLALEAGDQGIQNLLIDKHVNLSRVPHLVQKLKAAGIEVRGYFMLGFPGETRAQMIHTAEFALSLDLDEIALSVVSPLPGTPLFDQCVKENLFVNDFDVNDIRYSVSHIKMADITPDELEDIRRGYWERHKARKLAEGPKRGDVHKVFTTVEEFSHTGFKTVPPRPSAV